MAPAITTPIPSQGAPRTCRCIETRVGMGDKCRPRHVREHHAPVGALRLAEPDDLLAEVRVREHHAPVGALRQPRKRGRAGDWACQGAPRTCSGYETRKVIQRATGDRGASSGPALAPTSWTPPRRATAFPTGPAAAPVCPNLLQRPRLGRGAREETLIFRASACRRSRRGASLQQIRTRPAPNHPRNSTHHSDAH